MNIGVVSDTHGYFDPRLPQLLHGVNEILHAGDVGPVAVLDQLRAIAPVHAVRGNVDGPELELPPTLTRKLGSVGIHILHVPPEPQSVLGDWAHNASLQGFMKERFRQVLLSLPQECKVVIFGHSHEPCALVLGGRLFFNPGAAGKKRFSLPRCCGLLEVSPQGLRATFLGLERYNENLPPGAWLPTGGS